jgi:hypothetical protein
MVERYSTVVDAGGGDAADAGGGVAGGGVAAAAPAADGTDGTLAVEASAPAVSAPAPARMMIANLFEKNGCSLTLALVDPTDMLHDGPR